MDIQRNVLYEYRERLIIFNEQFGVFSIFKNKLNQKGVNSSFGFLFERGQLRLHF